ncbi:hypothetical protein J437_LFUL017209 [Ladona fulva]|uniref:Geranylgeranyl transferase type-2 subunit alpha n=1 Tax=Ladona fulva TaxID=123851 RepID=A0A8K0KM01_LADFU|nr:hypothetical protein J437_LFUL017209 [Ladona fulva]
MDLVQSAVFTDPGDQSAWFYLRWLLGRSGSSCRPRLRMGVLQQSSNSYSAALVLNVSREQSVLQAELRIGKKQVKGKWKCSHDLKVSYLWILVPDECNEDISAALERAGEERPSIVITEGGEEVDELFLKKVPPKEDGILEWLAVESMEDNGKSLLIPVLEEQLSLCTQLLDLEPDSRWALLTAVQLLRTLKMRQPKSKLKEYDEMVMEYLDKLIAIDPLRCGYYTDLRSDCCLESALHPGNLTSSIIDLSSLGLTKFPSPLASLPIALVSATDIDLSCNLTLTLPLVRTGALAALAHLPRLRCLRISASFHKLNNLFSSLNLLPNLPHLLQLELVPDDDHEVTLSKEVVHLIYEIIPSLRSLKPV